MKIKYLFGVAAFLAMFAACSDDDKLADEGGLDITELNMEAVGGAQQVRVALSGRWTAVPGASWVQVSPANGEGAEVCTIKVDTTLLANETRKATVRFVDISMWK